MPLHPALRERLDVPPSVSDEDVLKFWTARSRRYCKPCWELKYCPYGPLVEDFPLLPQSLEDAEEHQAYLKHILESGRFPDGKRLTPKHRKMFQADIDSFDPSDYPPKFPRAISDASCRVFGHLCPVYFVGEPLTETKDMRSQSRAIPRDVMLKVVRRDGQICQRCYQPVPDDQVEFDHVIPFSKGGTTTSENLKLCCRNCNRQKSNSIDDILSPNPIEHLITLRKRAKA
jgi:5-methylcytosine-specific restriction endonuclease McrA